MQVASLAHLAPTCWVLPPLSKTANGDDYDEKGEDEGDDADDCDDDAKRLPGDHQAMKRQSVLHASIEQVQNVSKMLTFLHLSSMRSHVQRSFFA